MEIRVPRSTNYGFETLFPVNPVREFQRIVRESGHRFFALARRKAVQHWNADKLVPVRNLFEPGLTGNDALIMGINQLLCVLMILSKCTLI